MSSFLPGQLGLYANQHERLQRFNLTASPLDLLKNNKSHPPAEVSAPTIQPLTQDTTEFSTQTPKKASRWKQITQHILSKSRKKVDKALHPKRWTRLLKPHAPKEQENPLPNP